MIRLTQEYIFWGWPTSFLSHKSRCIHDSLHKEPWLRKITKISNPDLLIIHISFTSLVDLDFPKSNLPNKIYGKIVSK